MYQALTEVTIANTSLLLALMAEEVRTRVPEIPVRSYRRRSMGWEMDILEVNGEFVFRFPRLPGRRERLKLEVSLLRAIHAKLSTPVPSYFCFWEGDRRYPRPFAGYRRIHGVPCTRSNLRTSWVAGLGRDLGRFLTELHSIPVSELPEDNRRWAARETWSEEYHRHALAIRRHAFPLMPKGDRLLADRLLRGTVRRINAAKFSPCLVHEDLTAGNILCVPSTGSLSGVLDWGDARIGDPAIDFVGLFEMSRTLGEKALEAYSLSEPGLRERIDLYLAILPLAEVAWGVQMGRTRFVAARLRDLHGLLAEAQ